MAMTEEEKLNKGTEVQNPNPGQFQSPWQDQLNDVTGQIQNRPGFQYDVNADALWNQYKDLYVSQGKQAMMDTMGQAQAMTGGYGNSYAQTVGQQAYQGYLQGLNDKLPDFYQMAMNHYQLEGDRLLNQYGMLADSRDFDYGQYRDLMTDWQWQTQWDENVRRYNYEHGLGEFASTGAGGGSGDSNNAKIPAPKQELTKAEQAYLIHQSVASGEITQNQAQALLKQLK